MPIPDAKIADAGHDPALSALMQAYMKKSLTLENFAFYFSSESNENQYKKYVQPKDVNITSKQQETLDKLARAGSYATDEFTKMLDESKENVEKLVNGDVLKRFSNTPEYKRWYLTKHRQNSEDGVKVVGLLTKDLKDPKTLATLKALMLIVETGRTPKDRKDAYTALLKLVKSPAKVPAIFKANELEVPK